MRPVSAERQRQRNATSFEHLDSIVAEVFQSLTDEATPRKDTSDGRRLHRRDEDVRRPARPASIQWDDDLPQTIADPVPHREGPPIAERGAPGPSGTQPDGFDLDARSASTVTSTFSAEDRAFLDGAVAFLRSRPNADLLLEDLWMRLVERPQSDAAPSRTSGAPERADEISISHDGQRDP